MTAGTQAYRLASCLIVDTIYNIYYCHYSCKVIAINVWLCSMIYWPVWDMRYPATGIAWRTWCLWTSFPSGHRRRSPTWLSRQDDGLGGRPTPPRRSLTPSDGSSTLPASSTLPMSPMDCHRPIKRNKLIYLIIITYVAPNIYRDMV